MSLTRPTKTILLSLVLSDTNVFLAGSILANAMRLLSTIILTRILTAADFGAVALVSSLQFFFIMLSDVGIFAYVVRSSDGDDGDFLNEVWTVRLIRGGVLCLTFALCAFPLAHLFQKPELGWLLTASSTIFLLEGLSSMAFATGARQKRIRRLTFLDLAPIIAQVFSSIFLAMILKNYWSIIIAMTISSAIKSIISYIYFPNSYRKIKISQQRAVDMWKFGRFIAISSIAQIAISQTDKIIFARIFQLGQFGLYSLASNLAQLPSSLTSNYSPRILYPIFSNTFHNAPENLSTVFYRSGRLFRTFYLFGSGALASLAPLVVTILYDDRYYGASVFLAYLSIGMIFKLQVNVASDLILSTGNSRHALNLSIVRVSTLGTLCIGLFPFWGAWGIIGAIVSVEAASQIYTWWVLRKMNILNFLEEVKYYSFSIAGYAFGYLLNYIFIVFFRVF